MPASERQLQTLELAMDWDNAAPYSADSEWTFNGIHKLLTYLEREHYSQYLPTAGPEHEEFDIRFARWLMNVDGDADRKILFRTVQRILFIGRQEFSQLYVAALNGPVTRWIIDCEDYELDEVDLATKVEAELGRSTWYCPFSDSMPISDFHHVNNLGGIEYRPDLRSLAEFADGSRIRAFMENHMFAGAHTPLKRVVILEDFIGSGTQFVTRASGRWSPLEYLVRELTGTPILFIPLIICPAGLREARSLEARFTNLKVEPIITLSERDSVVGSTESLFQQIAGLATRTYSLVDDGTQAPRPYHPHGFRETGIMLVLYHNTPANTLPLIQHQSSKWRALFPRSARVR